MIILLLEEKYPKAFHRFREEICILYRNPFVCEENARIKEKEKRTVREFDRTFVFTIFLSSVVVGMMVSFC
jgi:hypothetical protein